MAFCSKLLSFLLKSICVSATAQGEQGLNEGFCHFDEAPFCVNRASVHAISFHAVSFQWEVVAI